METKKCEVCGAEMERWADYIIPENRTEENEFKICEKCASKLPDQAKDAWKEILREA